jgi:hypothetical protein
MRTLLATLACLLALGGCASVTTHVVVLDPTARYEPTKDVLVLLRPPERPYVEIAKLESKGIIGEVEAVLIEDARDKAKALGADAIITLETLSEWHPPVSVWDPWPLELPWYRDRWARQRFWYSYGPPFPYMYPEYRVLPGGNTLTLRALAIRFK